MAQAEGKANMNYGTYYDLVVGMENKRGGVGEPAFRCGLPLRGGGWLVRDAGIHAVMPNPLGRRTKLRISWPDEVCWIKQIRVANC